MDLRKLGRRLYSARKERGLTSETLSERCNINATYLRQIESGVKIPSLPVFVVLCNNLGASPSYLLQDSLNDTEYTELNEMIQMMREATPSQIRMVSAMVIAALKTLPKE